MTKIMLISPPLSSDPRVKIPNHQVPLGFLYMADILEKKGFSVKILDCPLYYKIRTKISETSIKFGLQPEQISREIQEFKPDIVGVSCSFSMFESDSFDMVDLVKKISPKSMIVVGGAHASSNTKHVLRNENINLAVIGEGELTLLEIAQRYRDRKRLDNIKGTALIRNKKIIINKPRELIKNLDDLQPAWHLLDLKKYFEHPDNSLFVIRSPSINIATSRGCPGNCSFCSVQTVWGRKWRAMSAKKVVDDIEFLYKNYKVRHFRINDDNLTLDKKRIIEICKEILKRKIDIKWDTPSGIALWTLDKEVLSTMKKSGYYRVTFGIESGSKRSLKYICKNIDLEKTRKLIDHCHKIGLWVASFFIIGFPFETFEDIKLTEEYILTSGINFPFVFVAQPYPGTKMYQDFLYAGLLTSGLQDISNSTISKYRTKNFSAEQLNSFRRKIYIKFYLSKLLSYMNPVVFHREFLSKIKSAEDLKYVLKIMKSMAVNLVY